MNKSYRVLYQVTFTHPDKSNYIKVFATSKKIAMYLYKHCKRWSCTVDRISKDTKDYILSRFSMSSERDYFIENYIIDTFYKADKIINEL